MKKRTFTLQNTNSQSKRFRIPILRHLLLLGIFLFSGLGLEAQDCTNSNLGVLIAPQPSYTTCAVSSNGVLDAIAFNGEPGYTYLWSDGQTSISASGLDVGTYSVTVTDTKGCTAEASGIVELHPEGVWLMTSTTSACGNSGTASVSAMLGTSPYSYLWSNGQTTKDATGLAVGSHSVTVTDALGCQAVAFVDIFPGATISLFTTASYETCAGSSDATATVIASGGVAPYSYLWSDGQTTDIAVGLSAGTYGVTVTDVNGCSAATTQVVELSPEGIWIMVSGTDADCGANNGTAHVGVMTGVPPYTFTWNDPAMQTTADPVGLAPGTYTVVVTDSNGCTAMGSVTIGSNGTQLSVTITSTNEDCTNLGSATANVANGSGSYSYSWSNGGTTQTITNLTADSYTVDVTDNNTGCFGTAMVTIIKECTTTCEADAGNLTPNTINSCVAAGTSVNLSAVHTTGNVPAGFQTLYVLTTGSGLVIQSTNSTPDFAVSGSGLYTIHTLVYDPATLDLSIIVPGVTTGFDVNSLLIQGGGTICASLDVAGAPFNLYDNPTASINGPYTTCPSEEVQLTANTTGNGLTYVWTASNGTIDNPTSATPNYTMMAPGTYTITLNIVDNNGCSATATTTVTVNNSPIVDILPANASVCVGQSIDLSTNPSGPGYTYLWSASAGTFNDVTSATPTYTMMMPGTYTITVEVSDGNGCTGTGTTQVTISPSPTVEIIPSTPSTCSGNTIDFSTTTSGSGLTYSWTATGGTFDDPTSATPIYTMMTPGVYIITVSVSDAGGCNATASTNVTITSIPNVSVTPSGNPSVCVGESIVVGASASGGSAPYTYSWTATAGSFDDPSSATPTYTMMMPGTYTLTVEVTDANGCTDSATLDVTVNAAPTVSISPEDQSSCGAASVNFTATATGTSPISYLWSATGGAFSDASSATPTYTMMLPGTYTISVEVTDGNGCSGSASTTITVNPEITSCSASVTSSYFEGAEISTRGGSDGSASVSVVGGTAPFTYLWSDGQTTQEATGLSAGTYDVTISDAGGCSCISSVTLMDPAKLGNFVWEDIDQDGIQDPNEPVIEGVKVTLNGTTTAAGITVMRMLFTDANGMYMFDGLLPGTYKVTFETPTGYTPTIPNFGADDTVDSDADPAMGGMTQMVTLGAGDYDPTLDAGFYLCTNIGDYVWYDENQDGIQDPTEMGVEGVQVKLLMAGPDGVFCTPDDVLKAETTTGPNGEYQLSCVAPGDYIISFMNLPTDWTFSDANQGGDDTMDSDADPATGKTDPFTVTYGQPDDLTFDAGIHPICDQFFGGGGEISVGQQPCICPGEIPNPIINIIAPSGGSGPIEYMWMFSTVDVPFDTTVWKPIIGAPSTLEYQPGPLFQTTYFIRCARRLECPDFVESNTVTICVKDPLDCPSPPPFTTDAVTLSATVINGEDVELNWGMEAELDQYNFFVERSFDGQSWTEIGNRAGKGNQTSLNKYDYMDLAPRKGANYYRIRLVGLISGINYSKVLKIVISDEILAKLYPNPFIDMVNLAPIQDWESDGIIEIFGTDGRLINQYDLAKGRDIVELDLAKTTVSGVYLIKVTYTNSGKSTTFKVTRNKE